MGTWLKENWFKAGLLTVLVGSIAGAFYWYEWHPSQSALLANAVPTYSPIPTPPPEAYPDISTKDWNTYHNTRFEYTVKYPSNWTLGEPPVNGDGIRLYDDGDSKVVVYGSLMGPEFPNDFINGREILFQEQLDLAGGEKGKFLLINAGNSRSEYIMFVEHPDRGERYVVFASVSNDFLENNQGVLDAIMKSFVKLRTLPKI